MMHPLVPEPQDRPLVKTRAAVAMLVPIGVAAAEGHQDRRTPGCAFRDVRRSGGRRGSHS